MICSLCQQEKTLVRSHVLPEFIYSRVYDPNHQYFVLSTNEDKRPSKKRKGIYENLLCRSCEDIIGKHEDYAAKVLFGGVDIPNKFEYADCYLIKGIDYKKFKLFQLSLIWRSSVSNRPEFQKCDLAKHQNIIRNILYNENPGESFEYGCILFVIPQSNRIADTLVYPPEMIKPKIDGHRVYRAIFAGLFWAFYVSSHLNNFQHKEAFLSKNGDLPIFKMGKIGFEFLYKLGTDLLNKNRPFVSDKYNIG